MNATARDTTVPLYGVDYTLSHRTTITLHVGVVLRWNELSDMGALRCRVLGVQLEGGPRLDRLIRIRIRVRMDD